MATFRFGNQGEVTTTGNYKSKTTTHTWRYPGGGPQRQGFKSLKTLNPSDVNAFDATVAGQLPTGTRFGSTTYMGIEIHPNTNMGPLHYNRFSQEMITQKLALENIIQQEKAMAELNLLKTMDDNMKQVLTELGKSQKSVKQLAESIKLTRERILQYRTIVKGTLYTELIYRVLNKIFRWEEKNFIKNTLKRVLKRNVKQVGKTVAKQAGKQTVSGVANIVSQLKPHIDLDTRNFDGALKEYVKFSKKSFVEICNQKALNIAFKAIKYTEKANKSEIRSELMAPSKYPNRSIVQIMAIKQLKSEGVKPTKTLIRDKVNGIISSRSRAIGFLRSGWLPAIRIMTQRMGIAKKTSEKKTGKDKGGAIPAKALQSIYNTESIVFNSIQADGNLRANNYMLKGLQMAFDEEAASMVTYVKRKMEQAAARANRGV